MSESLEKGFSPENEPPEPSIRLEFFRHDEKDKPTTAGPRIGDEFVRLTQKGREHSTEVGKTKNPEPEVGLAYGSSRERSTEAALRQLLAEETEIGSNDSLEDIQRKISEQLTVGKKNIVSENLNFNWDGSQEFHDVAYDHYLRTKDALVFILEESDALVRKIGDEKSTSYSRAAARIAELVEKYIEIFPQWEKITAKDPEKYAQHQNEMQRFMGSHQDALEPFLLKIIDMTNGRAAVEAFIDSLPDKNGFGFGEGFSVRIVRDAAGEPLAHISFKGQEWTVDAKVIKNIIQDGRALDEEIRAGATERE